MAASWRSSPPTTTRAPPFAAWPARREAARWGSTVEQLVRNGAGRLDSILTTPRGMKELGPGRLLVLVIGEWRVSVSGGLFATNRPSWRRGPSCGQGYRGGVLAASVEEAK